MCNENKSYTKELQKSIVERIMEYAGTDMDSRLGNPHITKRNAIMLADYIKELQEKIK